jgi:CRISPR-associated protein Csb3
VAEHSIPVDLFNPGQVFACLGFLEAADILLGDAEGGFDWRNESDTCFHLHAKGGENPMQVVLRYLQAESTTVEWLSPSGGIAERDGGTTVVCEGVAESADPKAADLPGRLVGIYGGEKRIIPFGFWADGSSRFHTSFKKSTYANSSHTRFQNALAAIRSVELTAHVGAPFELKADTKSLFRLDPRGSTDPINAGTSPDTLRKGGIDTRVMTYPLCELLAVLGLQHARPKRLWDGEADAFLYHVWGNLRSDRESQPMLLPAALARAAVDGAFPFIAVRRFRVEHEEAKKGGDRRMTRITEEPIT